MKWKIPSISASSSSYVREAYHSGSWYDSDPAALDNTLSSFLQDARHDDEKNDLGIGSSMMNGKKSSPPSSEPRNPMPRGIIAPHAGYSYSGSTAAYAYAALGEALTLHHKAHSTRTTTTTSISSSMDTFTVIVLHPSHHVYLDGCALSNATEIQTPLGNLAVDSDLRTELLQQRKGGLQFQSMTQSVDEKEHSGEMQYPYIAKIVMDHHRRVMDENPKERGQLQVRVRVLPIMIGGISTEKEQIYGNLLAPYLARDNTFTVVSSDFCHWGKRFGYSPTSPPDHIKKPHSVTEIHQYIEWMDRLGMDEIANQEPGAFAKYIRLYKNTICGRHPISVYLWALKKNQECGSENVNVAFVKYAQSSRVFESHDSSVSYASAVVHRVD